MFEARYKSLTQLILQSELAARNQAPGVFLLLARG
jgi:hypothetical protein